MQKFPKSWDASKAPKLTKQEIKASTETRARINMSAEVAGAGLCPECQTPMVPAFISGTPALVCVKDRIALPHPDDAPAEPMDVQEEVPQ